jgi:hypothetical protein
MDLIEGSETSANINQTLGIHPKIETVNTEHSESLKSRILESYLAERFFREKQGDAYSELKEIKAGVPQGSVLGPILYLLYTSDLPDLGNNTVATFVDDTAILSVGQATRNLQGSYKQP